ncbi:MAG: nickel pincer cofactor biosynthesis protein LarB [Deltaproteobacteria bacterium]|nr:nickel pincer cofactor biosynthesis protein LarB [Deltaproteobacteria bacterium]
MDVGLLKDLLRKVKDGTIEVDDALEKLRSLPFEDIGFASIDHHRHLRRGFPEVIYGRRKKIEHIITIIEKMAEKGENVLVTRLTANKAKIIQKRFPKSHYHPDARILTLAARPVGKRGKGTILVISAGTADIPVAEEAVITAQFMGNEVKTLFDVGVSGLHRLLEKMETIMEASVIVVVAGMEGALPSIVGGLVDKPVVAVPTSAGYGASFEGISALLGMLNSCASGVTVVNIDNGFGAGYAASLMNCL